MHELLKQAILDSDITPNQKAVYKAQEFIDRYKIMPSYADVWRDGDMALFWHKQGCIAGLLFDDSDNVIWTFGVGRTGKIPISDFLGSQVHDFIKCNFFIAKPAKTCNN